MFIKDGYVNMIATQNLPIDGYHLVLADKPDAKVSVKQAIPAPVNDLTIFYQYGLHDIAKYKPYKKALEEFKANFNETQAYKDYVEPMFFHKEIGAKNRVQRIIYGVILPPVLIFLMLTYCALKALCCSSAKKQDKQKKE